MENQASRYFPPFPSPPSLPSFLPPAGRGAMGRWNDGSGSPDPSHPGGFRTKKELNIEDGRWKAKEEQVTELSRFHLRDESRITGECRNEAAEGSLGAAE